MKYFDELKRSMEYLASDSRTVFIGQAVAVPGTAMSNTLTDIAREKLIELPVAEEMQENWMSLHGHMMLQKYPFGLEQTGKPFHHMVMVQVSGTNGFSQMERKERNHLKR